MLTGEWSANGAIVKLAINNPFMTTDEKIADYVFNVRYAILRNLDYHFADVEGEWLTPFKAYWAGSCPPRSRSFRSASRARAGSRSSSGSRSRHGSRSSRSTAKCAGRTSAT